jgi:hypothetical protein
LRPGLFIINLAGSPVLGEPVVVSYAVSGTAVFGVDYLPLSGVVTIAAGQSNVTVAVVPILGALSTTATVVLTVVSVTPPLTVPPTTAPSATVTIVPYALSTVSHYTFDTAGDLGMDSGPGMLFCVTCFSF